jgi:hypothetical protein
MLTPIPWLRPPTSGGTAVQTLSKMYKYNTDQITRDSEFKYYFLGLVGADGYISSKSNRIEIALKESDVALLKAIRDVVCPGKKISYKQKQRAYRLTFDNKTIHKEVCKYMDPKNKSLNLIFPYGIPDEYISHFIRGYIDGDGNISVKKGQRKFDGYVKHYFGLRLRVLGTRAFLHGLSDNLFRLEAVKNRVTPHRKENENVFYCEWGYSQAKRVLDWVYQDATYKLDRKYKVFLDISTKDSDTLAANYGKPEGRYNTQESAKSSG